LRIRSKLCEGCRQPVFDHPVEVALERGVLEAEVGDQLVLRPGELAPPARRHAGVGALDAAVGQAVEGPVDRSGRVLALEALVGGGLEDEEAVAQLGAQPVGRIEVVVDAAAGVDNLAVELGVALLAGVDELAAGQARALAVEVRLLVVDAVAEVARQRQLVLVVGPGDAGVVAAAGADVGPHGAELAGAAVLLGDQVDDPARAVGPEGGRRVGHHLDALDLVGRHLLQHVGAAFAAEHPRRLAVDHDGDVGVAAQADVALHVDLHRRHVAQRVGDRAGGRLQVAGDAVAASVDRAAEIGARALHRHPLDGVAGGGGSGLGLARRPRLGRRRLGQRRAGEGGEGGGGEQPAEHAEAFASERGRGEAARRREWRGGARKGRVVPPAYARSRPAGTYKLVSRDVASAIAAR
jgi:hypothetical protein